MCEASHLSGLLMSVSPRRWPCTSDQANGETMWEIKEMNGWGQFSVCFPDCMQFFESNVVAT